MEFKKLSAVETVGSVSDTASVLIEENGVIKRAPKGEVGGIKIESVAEVGQVIAVKAVDAQGKPTEWECVDMGGSDVGSSGGGYDAVVRYDENFENPELLSGSYDDLVAKCKGGKFLNILIYGTDSSYNIVLAKIQKIIVDWDESYYIKVTFKNVNDDERTCFIFSDGNVSN